ncbi:VOC family protein [Jannaschia sp. LMIT008]|uniref:VOC family protein n=1 Tax=Jannaschia maritima TaxID=3032585 RepID=UPI00281125B3|nr:VOC family protein [Jannaschia sp. LMIT008]
MLNVHQITPFVTVPDLGEGIAFFEGLGFECTFRGCDPDYAFLRCDGGAIRLLADSSATATAAMAQAIVYVDVADVDQLHVALRPFLNSCADDVANGPRDQPYGQRELIVRAPGGTLIFFGSPIK